MNRFTLSQCRHQLIDRILDLALAFEIAVSEEGDNAPPSWKVSVRSTQLIGGTLRERQENRTNIGALYELRNKATHGGELSSKLHLKSNTKKTVEQVLKDCSGLYVILMRIMLSLRRKPEWRSLELEPRATK